MGFAGFGAGVGADVVVAGEVEVGAWEVVVGARVVVVADVVMGRGVVLELGAGVVVGVELVSGTAVVVVVVVFSLAISSNSARVCPGVGNFPSVEGAGKAVVSALNTTEGKRSETVV